MLNTPFLQINKRPPSQKYQIMVYTGTISGDVPDAEVSLALFGQEGRTKLKLEDAKNRFGRDKVDIFTADVGSQKVCATIQSSTDTFDRHTRQHVV